MIFSDTDDGKAALISLLNCILQKDDSPGITSIEFMPTHVKIDNIDEKESIMDMRVTTNANTEIDVEMQLSNVDNYIKRSIYYLSRMYTGQLVKGDDYSELRKCILINILNFSFYNYNIAHNS